MILKSPFYKDSIRLESNTDTQYFGKDAEDFLESINWHNDIEYLGKECYTSRSSGIIIGFEDSQSASDYYFIVYIPNIRDVHYQLANSLAFTKTIKI